MLIKFLLRCSVLDDRKAATTEHQAETRCLWTRRVLGETITSPRLRIVLRHNVLETLKDFIRHQDALAVGVHSLHCHSDECLKMPHSAKSASRTDQRNSMRAVENRFVEMDVPKRHLSVSEHISCQSKRPKYPCSTLMWTLVSHGHSYHI